jgi:uncharacterized protein YecE (DUF72 family)
VSANASNVLIGTCSWKYDSWKGIVYESAKSYRPNDYLADYAQRYKTVEIDQWFWSLFPAGLRMPDPKTVKAYADAVPDDFVFTVKAPNSITLTHFYAKQPAGQSEFAGRENPHFLDDGVLDQFLELLEPMHDKLGPIMFQFEYLNRAKMASREAFEDRFGAFIEKAPGEFEYAIETRNPDDLRRPFFDFLRRAGVGFVFLDGYHMPPIGDVFEVHRPVTAPVSIIRLHGPDRAKIEAETRGVWNRIVQPFDEGLESAVRIIDWNSARGVRTIVNVNNHYEGSAPLTIDRLNAARLC